MLATLGFVRLKGQQAPVLDALHRWLDSWRGIGDIERGMYWQGYDLRLERFNGEGWRTTFFSAGMAHSFTSSTGTAQEGTPWQAVQVAAWDTLNRT